MSPAILAVNELRCLRFIVMVLTLLEGAPGFLLNHASDYRLAELPGIHLSFGRAVSNKGDLIVPSLAYYPSSIAIHPLLAINPATFLTDPNQSCVFSTWVIMSNLHRSESVV